MFAKRKLLATLAVATMVFAACAEDDDPEGAPTTAGGVVTTEPPTETTSGELTDLGHGVSSTSVKVGIVIIDYDCQVGDFVDFVRGDQEATAQLFVDTINANGGVAGGREIDPIYRSYCPIPGLEPTPTQLCTQFTQDEEVFAVVGVFIDFTGEGHGCITKDNETVLITHEVEQAWIDASLPGLLLTPDSTKDARAIQLVNALGQAGLLDGQTVGLVGDQNGETRVNDLIGPALEDAGAELATTAILTIDGTDTSAAQSQFDSFIERWKTEGVTAVYFDGLNVSAKQFGEQLKQQLPDVQIYAGADSVLQQARDLQAAGSDPNPYEGMYSVTGQSSDDRWENKNDILQACVDTFEAETGETVKGPGEEDLTDDGKRIEIATAVTDFCGELYMFKAIADIVGAQLTIENWQAAVNSLGDVVLAPTDIASICQGKYAADDAAQLVQYDSSVGEAGDWVTQGDVIDADDTCAA